MERKNFKRSIDDKKLYYERIRCKSLCYKYNSISPDMVGTRLELLRNILGSTRSVYLIEQPFMCDYGYNIKIGENFYANHNLLILDDSEVNFGDNVLVGPNCSFYTTIHPVDPKLRQDGNNTSKPVIVGDNVWICGNVTVLPGVTIGDNSIIGAGSLVCKDIPPNAVAAGNPAKVIKFIK